MNAQMTSRIHVLNQKFVSPLELGIRVKVDGVGIDEGLELHHWGPLSSDPQHPTAPRNRDSGLGIPSLGPKVAIATGQESLVSLRQPHPLNTTAVNMSAAAKEDSHPAVKGPSALRSILAGSTAGAVEIGQSSPGNSSLRQKSQADH